MIAWLNSGGVLFGYDGDTGATVARVTDMFQACPGVSMTPPIAVKGRIIQVSASGRLCSYSLH